MSHKGALDLTWMDNVRDNAVGSDWCGDEGTSDPLQAMICYVRNARDKIISVANGGHVWDAASNRWLTQDECDYLRTAIERGL